MQFLTHLLQKKLLVWASLCFNHVDKDKPQRGQTAQEGEASRQARPASCYMRESKPVFQGGHSVPRALRYNSRASALTGAATLACVAVEGREAGGLPCLRNCLLISANGSQWRRSHLVPSEQLRELIVTQFKC